MMLNRLLIPLAMLVITGCFNAEPPTVDDTTLRRPSDNISEESEETTPTHDAERVVFQFINTIQNDLGDIPDIPADAELSAEDRTAALRALEQFIKSQDWELWFTYIEVVDGNEDFVDSYLRGADGDVLVLLLEYNVNVNEWRIDAYEIPDLTFARPDNESYADYVTRSVAESKIGAQPYDEGVTDDGGYFIEY